MIFLFILNLLKTVYIASHTWVKTWNTAENLKMDSKSGTGIPRQPYLLTQKVLGVSFPYSDIEKGMYVETFSISLHGREPSRTFWELSIPSNTRHWANVPWNLTPLTIWPPVPNILLYVTFRHKRSLNWHCNKIKNVVVNWWDEWCTDDDVRVGVIGYGGLLRAFSFARPIRGSGHVYPRLGDLPPDMLRRPETLVSLTNLKLWIASARHNFKWVKIPIK